MKKIIRLTESDLARIVRRVIRETEGDESDLIGSTVNLYRTKFERQQDFAHQVKITGVEGNANNITVTLDGGTTLTSKCTDTTGALMLGSAPMYNKYLYNTLRTEYCISKRDKKGNLGTVPNADFASTGGRMGNVG